MLNPFYTSLTNNFACGACVVCSQLATGASPNKSSALLSTRFLLAPGRQLSPMRPSSVGASGIWCLGGCGRGSHISGSSSVRYQYWGLWLWPQKLSLALLETLRAPGCDMGFLWCLSSVVEQAPWMHSHKRWWLQMLCGKDLARPHSRLRFQREGFFLTWSSFMSSFLPFLSFMSISYLYIHTHAWCF